MGISCIRSSTQRLYGKEIIVEKKKFLALLEQNPDIAPWIWEHLGAPGMAWKVDRVGFDWSHVNGVLEYIAFRDFNSLEFDTPIEQRHTSVPLQEQLWGLPNPLDDLSRHYKSETHVSYYVRGDFRYQEEDGSRYDHEGGYRLLQAPRDSNPETVSLRECLVPYQAENFQVRLTILVKRTRTWNSWTESFAKEHLELYRFPSDFQPLLTQAK